MSATAATASSREWSWGRVLVRAWLLTGVADGILAIVETLAYHRTLTHLFQGIASVPFGRGMIDGGPAPVALGVALHFCVALTWSAVFLLLAARMGWVRSTIQSVAGRIATAAIYGPCVWIVMSTLVIPFFVHRPVAITGRWWIELAGHVVSVGTPIVWTVAAGLRTEN
ncbi:MAG TPA: hypothetical protein VN651_04875 [Gemmatimonadaceae bacterium]|nr:hypothetical protein [Gemmatimonadaceae bacterium]